MLSCLTLLLATGCVERTGTEPLADYQLGTISLQLATDGSPAFTAMFQSADASCPGLDPAPSAELDGRPLAVLHHSSGGVRSQATRDVIPIENECANATVIYAHDGSEGRQLRLDGDALVMEFEQPLGARSLTLDPPEDGKIGPDDALTLRFSHADVVSASVTMTPLDVEPQALSSLGPDYTQDLVIGDTSASIRIPSDVPAGRLEVRVDASFGAPPMRCDGAAACSFFASAFLTETLERR